jgi:hypothetical protein
MDYIYQVITQYPRLLAHVNDIIVFLSKDNRFSVTEHFHDKWGNI